MPDYPRREQFHAHRVTRLLFKSCACQDMIDKAVLLIVHIAHTEDAARYQGPVRYWNQQLMSTLGMTSPKQLTRARSQAIDSGWLHYERDSDRAVGRYWTLIPPGVRKYDDAPIEEIDEQRMLSPAGKQTASRSPVGTRSGTRSGTQSGTQSGKPSYPIPVPGPTPPPPPPNKGSTREGEKEDGGGGGGVNGFGAEWEDLARSLSRLGVADVSGSIRGARGNGAAPRDVAAALAHWRTSGDYSLGQLHYRVRSCFANQPADEGWPPAKRKRRRAVSAPELRAGAIIRTCRAAGLGDAQIEEKLCEEGLTWP